MRAGTFLSSLFSITDEQAMWRVRTQDDPQAFAQLVARWERPVLRVCARMTGDHSRGEDLKQETFTRVFVHRKEYRPDMKFSTWLWRIALNLCYDELRRVARRGECPLEPDDLSAAGVSEPSEACPDARLVAEEESELVRQGLLRLPETSRTVLVLRYCEGCKLREIAEILQLPLTTISSRLAVALAQLTRILQPKFSEQKVSVIKGSGPPRPLPTIVQSL